MSYAEKLKSPKWQKKRLQILSRDNFTCRKCGDTETTLHVHHKEYQWGKDPWDYEADNFETLCEDCHEITERMKKDFEVGPVIKNSNIDRTLFAVGCRLIESNIPGAALFKRNQGESEIVQITIVSIDVIRDLVKASSLLQENVKN